MAVQLSRLLKTAANSMCYLMVLYQ